MDFYVGRLLLLVCVSFLLASRVSYSVHINAPASGKKNQLNSTCYVMELEKKPICEFLGIPTVFFLILRHKSTDSNKNSLEFSIPWNFY